MEDQKLDPNQAIGEALVQVQILSNASGQRPAKEVQ